MSASLAVRESPSVFAWLPAALERGATILTPNLRTARLLADRADALAARAGAVTWQAANILPWRAWTATLWQNAVIDGVEGRVLLNELQERALWINVIQNRPVDTLRPARSQADLCMRALRLLGSHDVQGWFKTSALRGSTSDASLFRLFYEDFTGVCGREGYLPSSHLDRELAMLQQAQQIVHTDEFLLCGFDQFSPAQRALLDVLRRTGVDLKETPATGRRSSPPVLMQCATPREEWQQCARWVRERLELENSTSIAIVAPDLENIRGELERELRLALAPELADVTRPATPPYEFSSGRTLRTLPLVRDALTLLRWCAGEVTLDEAGALLRSRHLALVESPETGASLDERVLRARPGFRKAITLRQCARALEAHGAGSQLLHMDRAAREYRSQTETHAHFADAMRLLLRLAGWPGIAVQNSAEFQATERWERLLDQVATLDLLHSSTRFADVLETIHSLAADTLFEPENLAQPVQVMSFTEALGSTADAMWFLSAGSTIWPARRTPDPLLPLSLQRELHTPGTDEQRDEEVAARALARLTEAMGSACFSYSSDQDGEVAQPASLVQQCIDTLEGSCTTALPDIDLKVLPATELIFDKEPLPSLPSGQVAGGVSILTTQSHCGFRAWAEKRLFTVPRDPLEDGLSARERGDQVHAVLDRFWQKAKDQATLKRMSKASTGAGSSERDELLWSCIAEVCRSPESGVGWEQAYSHVQEMRLFRLVSAWLEFEETRQPFQVLQLERSLENVPVGPLRLRMRVDRVDSITSSASNNEAADAAGIVLIDYKTGAASRNDWLGERPEQPQLPAYAVTAALAAGLHQIDGIAFGLVRTGADNLKLEGLAEPGLLSSSNKRKEPDFAEQRALWTVEIERLATAFADGDAAVAPRIYPQTCKNCGQRIFCRVNAATLWQEEDDTGEEEGAPW